MLRLYFYILRVTKLIPIENRVFPPTPIITSYLHVYQLINYYETCYNALQALTVHHNYNR